MLSDSLIVLAQGKMTGGILVRIPGLLVETLMDARQRNDGMTNNSIVVSCLRYKCSPKI